MKKAVLYLVFITLIPTLGLAQTVPFGVAPVETIAKEAFLIDANTGTVLYAKDADTPVPTSSMSKMMTVYLVFDALQSGKLKMDDQLPVSEHAWKQEGSRMYLNLGQTARVEDLIRGVVIQSGNDAAVVFAEALGGGTETVFAEMLNAKAKQLGMTNSHFMNATGLPDPQHYASARDLATLALALLRDFPEYYHYFSELSFTYNGISQGNRNPLLYHPEMHVDGIKTGHTEAGGMGLTASSLREGRRLVLVINGIPDTGKLAGKQDRADESAHLLDWGYREFGLYPIAKNGQVMGQANVWLGQAETVPVIVPKDVLLTLPRTARVSMKATVSITQPVAAPIAKDQVIGKLSVTAPNMATIEFPLVAGNDVARAGFFTRAWTRLLLLFGR